MSVTKQLTDNIIASGETKTVAEMAQAPHAIVNAAIIAKRDDTVNMPETAIGSEPAKKAVVSMIVGKNGRHAFGETKTLAEWSRDPRCKVHYVTLFYRIRRGMSLEDAISLPTHMTKGAARIERLTASGETKTIREWSRDPRCKVLYDTLADRIQKGWSIEDAMSLAPNATSIKAQPILDEASGESKTVREWSQDPRCKVSYTSLKGRIKSGWSLKDAMSVELYTTSGRARTYRMTASGETKTIRQWSQDPRCKVAYETLKYRVNEGWLLEDAISIVPHTTCSKPKPMRITAWGETKLIEDWLQDSRCKVPEKTIKMRLKKGESPEDAIALPRFYPARSGNQLESDRLYELNGKSQTLLEWSKDPACAPSYFSLRKRINRGMSLQEAMSLPPQLMVPGHSLIEPKLFTAFGETKSLREWSKDPRCSKKVNTLRQRLARGMSLEHAMLGTLKVHPQFEALGSKMSLIQWAQDPRCAVPFHTLKTRIAKGWELEAALTTRSNEFHESRNRGSHPITAFGETKLLREWVKDPRVTVCYTAIRTRLANGMSPEEAIGNPSGPRGRKPKLAA